jgi:ribonuclease J
MAKKETKSSGESKLVPLHDRVVLKRDEAEGKTAGGIVLPDTAKDKPQKGTVVSVGEGSITRDGKRHPLTLKPGDRVIFSSRTIPGNEKAVGAIHNALADQNIEIITDRQALVHVSGHPRREELKQMYGWVRPRIAIPAHGEPLHLHEHARLATEMKVPHVLVVTNGDMIALDPTGPVKVDDVPSGRIFQDGELRIGAGEKTVPDRRKLSFAGIVSVAIAIDDKGNIAGDLEIACMGLPPKTVDGDTFDDVVNDAVLDLVENMPKQRRRDPEGLRNSIEKAVRGAVGEEWGKKPVVHALVIEV